MCLGKLGAEKAPSLCLKKHEHEYIDMTEVCILLPPIVLNRIYYRDNYLDEFR